LFLKNFTSTMAGLSPEACLGLLRSGADADVAITCNGWQVKAHKLILKSASDFFTAALSNNFKVSRSPAPRQTTWVLTQ
jgi:hypothetical protein